MKETASLFLIPTPIGNLEDITLRALRLLGEVELILAEDTRNTKKLLSHFNIETNIKSYHAFNEHKETPGIIEQLKHGSKYALVTDAGTPGISDPGFLLVRECLLNQVEIECLPGPTAFVPALVKSGFPTDRFVFEGFLPHKKGRKKKLEILKEEERTIVLYESPHRIMKSLKEFSEVFGKYRMASISRELTKKFEETRNGTFDELLAHYSKQAPKGEIVIVISGYKD